MVCSLRQEEAVEIERVSVCVCMHVCISLMVFPQGKEVAVEIECVCLLENKRRLCTAAEGIVKIWNFNVGTIQRWVYL